RPSIFPQDFLRQPRNRKPFRRSSTKTPSFFTEKIEMKKHIAVLAGDGIGPEITDGAVTVLQTVAKKYGHEFTFEPLLMGCCAIEACGEPLPAHTVERCLASDSVLLGAVGGM